MTKKKASSKSKGKKDRAKSVLSSSTGDEQTRLTLDVHYIKDQQYRTVHVDGAWGGPTPNGLIHMSVFAERSPIPKLLKFDFSQKQLGPEVARETKAGIIREVQVGLILNLDTAKSIHKWLGEKIEFLERLNKK